MKKSRFTAWKQWQQFSLNGPLYKLLVLLGLAQSPTFKIIYAWEKIQEDYGMETNNKEEKVKTFGYRLGQFFGTVCFLCFTVIVIAATIKFVFWLF